MTKSLNDTGRFFVVPQLTVATQHQYGHFSMWLQLTDLVHDTHTAPQRMHSFRRVTQDIQHVQDEALTLIRMKL